MTRSPVRAARWRAAALAAGLLLGSAAAQDIELRANRARWRAGLEWLDAEGPDDLWAAGLHYDLLDRWHLLPGSYVGVGGFGSVAGDRGGLLVAGLTVGMRYEASPSWALDFGQFVGGGGGDFEPEGDRDWSGGLYLRPHLALEYGRGLARWRFEVSHVLVPGGALDSTQFSVGLQGVDELLTARYTIEDLALIDDQAFYQGRLPLSASLQYLDPLGGSRRRDGRPLDEGIGLSTLSVERGLGGGWFVPLEVSGAFAGGIAGYAQLLAGLGYRTALFRDVIHWRAQAMVGVGGGGQVDTGGGLLAAASTGLELRIADDWLATVLAGYQLAPDGDFHAAVGSVGLSWSPAPLELRNGYARQRLADEGIFSYDARLDSWTVQLLSKLYDLDTDSALQDGTPLTDVIHLVGVGAEKEIAEQLDLSVRAFTAWEGEVGGYREGQLGLRYRIPVLQIQRAGEFYLQYHAGAAGGGGVEVGGGFLHNLSAGWRWHPWRGVRIGFEAGRVEAEDGRFEGDFYSLGLSFGVTRPLVPRER